MSESTLCSYHQFEETPRAHHKFLAETPSTVTTSPAVLVKILIVFEPATLVTIVTANATWRPLCILRVRCLTCPSVEMSNAVRSRSVAYELKLFTSTLLPVRPSSRPVVGSTKLSLLCSMSP